MKRALVYGLLGGALIALLKYVEYRYFIGALPAGLYGGAIALVFTALGLWFGLRSAPAKETVVVRREIGERLFVSENTVKTHSSRVFQKLGVSRRTQAVQRGKEFGLIP